MTRDETREQLNKLPKSMADSPQSHVLALFQAFFKDVEDYTSGYPTYFADKGTLSQDVKKYYSRLQRDIQKTKPEFSVEELLGPVATALPGLGHHSPEIAEMRPPSAFGEPSEEPPSKPHLASF